MYENNVIRADAGIRYSGEITPSGVITRTTNNVDSAAKRIAIIAEEIGNTANRLFGVEPATTGQGALGGNVPPSLGEAEDLERALERLSNVATRLESHATRLISRL